VRNDTAATAHEEDSRRRGLPLLLVLAVLALLCLLAVIASGHTNGTQPPLLLAGTAEEAGWWTRISVEESEPAEPEVPPTVSASIPSDVLFTEGSADLEAASRDQLRDLARTLQRTTGPITIVGHTDMLGDEDANELLGSDRAEAVAAVLVELGVAADRLSTDSLGESQPTCPQVNPDGTDNADCRARCRRVVVTYTRT
jgi:outer membrane protein OmpA-like peptidoglycan-associated protein